MDVRLGIPFIKLTLHFILLENACKVKSWIHTRADEKEHLEPMWLEQGFIHIPTSISGKNILNRIL